MKNKNLIIILIPLVIIIWGIVFRQIIVLSKSKSQPVIFLKNEKALGKMLSVSYKISLDYQDPFLGRIPWRESEKPAKQNNVGRVDRDHIITPDSNPDIQYYGLIICENNRVGLVGLGDKLVLVRENAKLNDMYILSLTTDSITITYHEKTISYYAGR